MWQFSIMNTYAKFFREIKFDKPFLDGGRHHIETSPWICGANQWTGFYMVTASVMKELKQFSEMFGREVLRLSTSQPFLRLCILGIHLTH